MKKKLGPARGGDFVFNGNVTISHSVVGGSQTMVGGPAAAGPASAGDGASERATPPEGALTPPPPRAQGAASGAVRVAHLSDLHVRAETGWDARAKLGALVEDLAAFRARGLAPDVVVITGDLTWSGTAAEMALAEAWIRDVLLPGVGLTPAELVLVAGNHDLSRGAVKPVSRMTVDGLRRSRSQDEVAAVLGDPDQRAVARAGVAAFDALRARLGLGEGPVQTWKRTVRGVSVGVAGLCTAWAAAGEDRGKLLLGRWQVEEGLAAVRGCDVKLAALHHPLDWLEEWDGDDVRPRLHGAFDVLLRGHLHRDEPVNHQGARSTLLELAAGSAVPGGRWPAGWQLVELDPGAGEARVHLRAWDDESDGWIAKLHPKHLDGVVRLPLGPPPAPRPEDPLPPPVGVLAARVREVAEGLPDVFHVEGGPRLLKAVCVRVGVRQDAGLHGARRPPRSEEAPRKAGRVRAGGGGRSHDDAAPEVDDGPEVRRLQDVLAHPHRRWSLLGDPGAGKTTLLHELAVDLLDVGERLPVLLRASQLQAGDDLAAAVTRAYGPVAADEAVAAVAAGRAVVLIDGQDEAVDADVAQAALRGVAGACGEAPVVVASRSIGWRAPSAAFRRLDLLALEEPPQRALLAAWVGDGAVVDRTLERMRARPRLRRMAENPLLLTLCGILMRAGEEVPDQRGPLYKRALGVLAGGSHRPEKARRLREPMTALSLLSRVALALHAGERDTWRTALLAERLKDSARDRDALATWGGAEAFLAEVAHTTGLLVPEGPPRAPDGYRFPHRTFREYLAAQALEAELAADGVGRVPQGVFEAVRGAPNARGGKRRGARGKQSAPAPTDARTVPCARLREVLDHAVKQPSTWSEVLALTAGLLGEGGADALVRQVAAERHPELLLRVVAEAEGISADTVRAALAVPEGRDAWEARVAVLEQLPNLVPDAAVVVSLLWRFAQQTRDGNDLFWARHLLLQVAEGALPGMTIDGDARREARVLAQDVFVHLGEENRAAALEMLEQWWRVVPPDVDRMGRAWEVPATFRMGSTPETDPDRNEDEGPAHNVTLARRFEMNAVPVTWAMYRCFDPDKAHPFGEEPDAADQPVVEVTWYEAAAFATWVGCRLPTEEEWEFACRAGSTTRFWSGDENSDLFDVAWVVENSGWGSHAVATPPTERGHHHPFGLHDVHGSGWEWCAEPHPEALEQRYRPRRDGYQHDPADPIPEDGPRVTRAVRGGSWGNESRYARSACRYCFFPGTAVVDRGFRLVRLPLSPASGGGS
jgi:formylglycine-generating enzyme required for sulfatase activity